MLCSLLFCSLKVYANTCHWQPNCSYRRYFCDFNWTSPETLYIINLFESSLYPPEIVYRLREQFIKHRFRFQLCGRAFSVILQNNSSWGFSDPNGTEPWFLSLETRVNPNVSNLIQMASCGLKKKKKGLLLSCNVQRGFWNSKSQH